MSLYLKYKQLCLSLVVSISCGLGIGGCGEEEFDPASLLSDYRLIAIQADPPVISITQESVIRIFDYHPDELNGNRPAFTYEWSVCPFTLGSPVQYQCFVDEVKLEADGPEATLTPLDLLMELGELEQLQDSSEQLSSEMTMFDEGKIDLYVKIKTKQNEKIIFESVKRVTLDFLSMDMSEASNPPLSSFKVRLEKEEGEEEGKETQETEFKTKEKITLEVALEDNLDSDMASKWVYTWYTTDGKIETPTLFGDETDLQTNFTFPEDSGPLRVYLTVRDEQGGVNLMYRDFTVIDSEDESTR